jgi:hypothetical protein
MCRSVMVLLSLLYRRLLNRAKPLRVRKAGGKVPKFSGKGAFGLQRMEHTALHRVLHCMAIRCVCFCLKEMVLCFYFKGMAFSDRKAMKEACWKASHLMASTNIPMSTAQVEAPRSEIRGLVCCSCFACMCHVCVVSVSCVLCVPPPV